MSWLKPSRPMQQRAQRAVGDAGQLRAAWYGFLAQRHGQLNFNAIASIPVLDLQISIASLYRLFRHAIHLDAMSLAQCGART